MSSRLLHRTYNLLPTIWILICWENGLLQVEGVSWFGFFPSRSSDRSVSTYTRRLPSLDEAAQKARILWNEIESRGRMNPCWKRSLVALQNDCGSIRADGALRTRLALAMAACDSEGDDRSGASCFYCKPYQDPHKCVKRLSEPAYAIFVQYRLHADVLCAFLQEELFQQRTEASVASLISAVESSKDFLANLQHSSAKMMYTTEKAMETQQETKRLTAELQEDVQQLQKHQTNTMNHLQVSADGILSLSKHTEDSLVRLQDSFHSASVNASRRLNELAAQAAEHYAAMDHHTSSIFRVLNYIEQGHRKMMYHAISLRATLQYVIFLLFILLCTAPKRTAAARMPALGILTVGPLAFWFYASNFVGYLTGIVLTMSAAIITIGYFAYTYVPLEHLQRKMIHEEVMRAVQKGQSDFMSSMISKDVIASLNHTDSSEAATMLQMTLLRSLFDQGSNSLVAWNLPPREAVPMLTPNTPLAKVCTPRAESNKARQDEFKDLVSKETVLAIDIEPTLVSSFLVAERQKTSEIFTAKRSRSKRAASPSDISDKMTKPSQSNPQRRKRIEK